MSSPRPPRRAFHNSSSRPQLHRESSSGGSIASSRPLADRATMVTNRVHRSDSFSSRPRYGSNRSLPCSFNKKGSNDTKNAGSMRDLMTEYHDDTAAMAAVHPHCRSSSGVASHSPPPIRRVPSLRRSPLPPARPQPQQSQSLSKQNAIPRTIQAVLSARLIVDDRSLVSLEPIANMSPIKRRTMSPSKRQALAQRLIADDRSLPNTPLNRSDDQSFARRSSPLQGSYSSPSLDHAIQILSYPQSPVKGSYSQRYPDHMTFSQKKDCNRSLQVHLTQHRPSVSRLDRSQGGSKHVQQQGRPRSYQSMQEFMDEFDKTMGDDPRLAYRRMSSKNQSAARSVVGT